MSYKKASWEKSIKREIEEIQRHRWLESEKAGYDIGSRAAALDWIEKHAADFRENWERENVVGDN
jgi:hypothetical protein